MHRIVKRGALVALLGASPPVNTVAPVVTGEPVQGATLTTTTGTWTGATSYAYQWMRDGAEIAGATAATRTVTIDDALAVMSCEVTATGPGGVSAPVASTPVGPWQPTDLADLELFVHAPWEQGRADGGRMGRARDWTNPARLWHIQVAANRPTFELNAGDGLPAIAATATTRFWQAVNELPRFSREFTAYTVAERSSNNAYMWRGIAGGPSIVSQFALGAFVWYGNAGDRYTIQALPGDTSMHVAGHIHKATSVVGRLDGTTVYDTPKTTVDYAAGRIDTLLTSASAYWRGRVRSILLVRRALGEDEVSTLEAWLASPKSPRVEPLTVTSPAPWQTYQRDLTTGLGTIPITATLALPWRISGVGVEARFDGGAWTPLTVGELGAVSGTIAGVSPARGTLEVRLTGPASYTASVASVAVGDVYVVAGQSNAMGQGTSLQASSGALGTAVLTGAYQWVGPAADPVTSSADIVDTVADNGSSPAGSPWPILGDLLGTRDAVPVAFVPCAKGSTTFASWVPGADRFDRSTLYGQMAHRAQASGARAVLWYLGESDVIGGSLEATVSGHLVTIADAIDDDLGIPSYWAKIHSWPGGASTTAVNNGITSGVAGSAGLPGPDQSGILTSNLHYLTTPELTQLATAWRDALP